jgi:hypothetical protein
MNNLPNRAASIYKNIKNGLENQFDEKLAILEIENELWKVVHETTALIVEVSTGVIENAVQKAQATQEKPRATVFKPLELPDGYFFRVTKQGMKIVRQSDRKVLKTFPHAVMAHMKQEDFDKTFELLIQEEEL